MMHSITNDRAKTDNGTKYTGIHILAVLFWIEKDAIQESA